MNRSKWTLGVLVGFGITFGLQVLISLVYTAVAYGAAHSETGMPQETITPLVFGLTLGAFLVGGFVVGWLNEDMQILMTILGALWAQFLGFLFMMVPGLNTAQFVSFAWLRGGMLFTFQGLLFIVFSVVGASIGSYLGWPMSVPIEGKLDRWALLIGLIGAIVGMFILLALGGSDPSRPDQPGLPWYFLLIVLVMVLLIIGAGFLMFMRESKDADEISIDPDRHKKQRV